MTLLKDLLCMSPDIKPERDKLDTGDIEENASIPIKLFGIDHAAVGTYLYDPINGEIIEPPPLNFPMYIQLGDGDEVVATASIDDALVLSDAGIGSRTIAPLNPEHLPDVCIALKANFSNLRFLLLGKPEHSSLITFTKRELGCLSRYPKRIYSSWAEFCDKEGISELTAYIRSKDIESESVDQFTVKDHHVKDIENQRFIFPNLIINQHIIVICAEPNAGKTTILNWVCSQISELNQVRYLNMDCSGAELKEYQQYASDHGFEFINFDITDTTIENFFKTLQQSPDLNGKVYIVDTLKKVADPMQKARMKEFMSMLRRLCVKGATFVLLAHTNKHKDFEGKPVFEGVGDVRADCDEMIYLIPTDNTDGTKTITTQPDKVRGKFEGIAFSIGPDRSVSLTGYVDPATAQQQKRDESIIRTVMDALSAGITIQKNIVDQCRTAGHGKNEILRVLERHSDPDSGLWSRSKGDHNAWVYLQVPTP